MDESMRWIDFCGNSIRTSDIGSVSVLLEWIEENKQKQSIYANRNMIHRWCCIVRSREGNLFCFEDFATEEEAQAAKAELMLDILHSENAQVLDKTTPDPLDILRKIPPLPSPTIPSGVGPILPSTTQPIIKYTTGTGNPYPQSGSSIYLDSTSDKSYQTVRSILDEANMLYDDPIEEVEDDG